MIWDRGLLASALSRSPLRLPCAMLHAAFRCRRSFVRSLAFIHGEDLVIHFAKLIQDSWIYGCPLEASRAERRARRCSVPSMPHGSLIYKADDTSRERQDERHASFGVVLVVNNLVVARLGRVIGDETNNVADTLALFVLCEMFCC